MWKLEALSRRLSELMRKTLMEIFVHNIERIIIKYIHELSGSWKKRFKFENLSLLCVCVWIYRFYYYFFIYFILFYSFFCVYMFFVCVCMWGKIVWKTVTEISLKQHDKDTINRSLLFMLKLSYDTNRSSSWLV